MIKKQKSLLKKIIFSNIILIICVFLIIFLSSNLIRDYLNKKQLNKEVTKLQEGIKNLIEKNNQLTNLIDYFKSSDYLEEEARMKLNKKKPGEEIIIIPDAFNQRVTSTLITLTKDQNKNNLNNFKKWWQYFFATEND